MLTSGKAIGAVVWPSKVSVKVPPVAFATAIVWFSLVRMSFCGGLLFAPTAVAGVSSPVDHPQVVVLVEVDVTGDVAARPAVDLDLHDLLLGRDVQIVGLPARRRT